jgi:hypothetical protein
LQNRVSSSDKRNCSRKNPSAGQSIIVPGNECWSPATTTVGGTLRDLAFYILENDSGTCQNLEEFPQEWEGISKAWILSMQRNKLKRLPRRFCAPKLVSLLNYVDK